MGKHSVTTGAEARVHSVPAGTSNCPAQGPGLDKCLLSLVDALHCIAVPRRKRRGRRGEGAHVGLEGRMLRLRSFCFPFSFLSVTSHFSTSRPL